jgi:uncharacterized protein YaiL (DUF2058 family)
MGNSLFDQLQKVGLVDEKQAKKAKKQKHQQIKQQKGKKAKAAQAQPPQSQQAQAEKAAHDRELNRQRKAAAEQKAIAAQVRQLIETNRIRDAEGDVAFNFTDQGKVRRLYVTSQLQAQLASGLVAIVRLDAQYALVPAQTAEKIRDRDPASVVLHNAPSQQSATPAEDDPYADFQVPDDLMW